MDVIGLIMTIPALLGFILSQNFFQTAVVYFVLVVSNAFIWISSNVLLAARAEGHGDA